MVEHWQAEIAQMEDYSAYKVSKYNKAIEAYINVANQIYDAMVESVKFDLALIELEPLRKSKKKNIYPKLPSSDYVINPGDLMYTTGYGGTGHILKTKGTEMKKSLGLTWGNWKYPSIEDFVSDDKATDEFKFGNILYNESPRMREVFNVVGYRPKSQVDFNETSAIMGGDSGGGVYHQDASGNFTLVGINSSASEFREAKISVGIFDHENKLGEFKTLANDFNFSLGNWGDEKVPNSYTYLLNFIDPDSENVDLIGLSKLVLRQNGLYQIKDFSRYLRKLEYFNSNLYVDLRSQVSQKFFNDHIY